MQLEEIEKLKKELESTKKLARILQKRDTALRKLLSQIMWLKETETSEEETSKKLDNLFAAYSVNESLNGEGVKLTYYDRNWFANKQIDLFLAQFNQPDQSHQSQESPQGCENHSS